MNRLGMLLYSALLTLGLALSAPWWLLRMLTTQRYREGLAQRLGWVPRRLRDDLAQRRVVWVHAVSVGEVLAATRLVAELEAGRGGGCGVVVSTTTRTGQALARERFGADRVFYFPLDFAWAVRRYLRALRPAALVLMESELWPRMLWECRRAGVPVAVVNARVSDRSFARGLRVRAVWGRVLRGISLWLAQSEEDARRLVAMGARAESVLVVGNLKYDVRAVTESRVAEKIKEVAAGRPIVVAGSTCADRGGESARCEEDLVLGAWWDEERKVGNGLLVLAARHPERFGFAAAAADEFRWVRASSWGGEDAAPPLIAKNAMNGAPGAVPLVVEDPINEEPGVVPLIAENAMNGAPGAVALVAENAMNGAPDGALDSPDMQIPSGEDRGEQVEIVLLDTIGDLAAVYGVADVAFVGGSLVRRGGHNPLEPAQFGVPVVIGPSYENFRDVVGKMQAAQAICIVQDEQELGGVLLGMLKDPEAARAMGERGRQVFEAQQGATARAVDALVGLIQGASR